MDEYLFFLVPFIFVAMWFIVTNVLRKLAGTKKQLDFEPGQELRSSGWGSASINGVGGHGCVKVHEHSEGYLVRTMWIFGGGKLWLSKAILLIGDKKQGGLFVPRSRVLICGMDQVILYGKLADFLEKPNGHFAG